VKKLILALAAVAFIGIGGSAVQAQTTPNPTPVPSTSSPVPDYCAEADDPARGDVDPATGIPENCTDWYVSEGANVKPPASTTTAAVAVDPPGNLPRTGSGVSPILGIGALLLIGGAVVVVASRRRSSAAPST
jgi:LPXTG-motif cell wall-anchored protein